MIAIPTIHNVKNIQNPVIPYFLVNLSTESVNLPKRELLGQLIPLDDEDNNIIPETIYADICHVCENTGMNEEEIGIEKKFITSPADVEVQRKVELQDADVSEEHRKQFEELCEEYNAIFSKDSGDLGRTPLVIMDIDN